MAPRSFLVILTFITLIVARPQQVDNTFVDPSISQPREGERFPQQQIQPLQVNPVDPALNPNPQPDPNLPVLPDPNAPLPNAGGAAQCGSLGPAPNAGDKVQYGLWHINMHRCNHSAPPLIWDAEVAHWAQDCAAQCRKGSHCMENPYDPSAGENSAPWEQIMADFPTGNDGTTAPYAAGADLWYYGLPNKPEDNWATMFTPDGKLIPNYLDGLNLPTHGTHLLNKEHTQVGCGDATCASMDGGMGTGVVRVACQFNTKNGRPRFPRSEYIRELIGDGVGMPSTERVGVVPTGETVEQAAAGSQGAVSANVG